MAGLVTKGELVAQELVKNPGMTIREAGKLVGAGDPYDALKSQKAQALLAKAKDQRTDKARGVVDRVASAANAGIKALEQMALDLSKMDPRDLRAEHAATAAGIVKTLLGSLDTIQQHVVLLDGRPTETAAEYERTVRTAFRVGRWSAFRQMRLSPQPEDGE